VIPLSLVLVLSSLGMLIAGLLTDRQPLLWASLLASLGACGCLVVSVLSRRRVAPTGTPATPTARPIDIGSPAADPAAPAPTSPAPAVWPSPPDASVPPDPSDLPPAPAAPPTGPPAAAVPPPAAGPAGPDAVPTQRTDAEQWPTSHPTGQPAADVPADPTAPVSTRSAAGNADSGGTALAGPGDEPAVEDIPVAAALRVAQLDDDVLVVDGRPRYHLAGCPAVADRATVALPVSGARRGGFTPCAECRPDSTLLARSRSAASPPS
jgi:hypothetical protein